MDGLQIDLDGGRGLITRGHITDYILNPCTMLDIEFTCEDLLVFHPNEGHYFRFLTLEWIPINCRTGHTSQNTWWYKIKAIPKQMFTMVEKTCLDMRALASVLGVELSDNSSNLPIKCPVINQPVYALMRMIRLESFNDAAIKNQFGEAYFLYCNSHTLTAITWNDMIKSKANSLELPEGLAGTEEITLFDARIEDYLNTPAYPVEWNEEDYLSRLNGVTYEMKTLNPALFAQMYTVKFSNTDVLDAPVSMLCFFTDCDLTDNNRMINRFTQIQFD